MSDSSLNLLSASEAKISILNRNITSEKLVLDCIERIEAREPVINAWVEFEKERAIEEAQLSDKALSMGNLKGPLHGLPIALKDIIDTCDFPTQNGSRLFKGRRPAQDAQCVSLLRNSGAIIMGKTVTTEFALTGAGPTANPNNILHTPGGSSSGSAASVADFMVPVSIGSQTGGSMIRPASYCGIYGFKPSFGSISRRGVFCLARALDHLGVYARSVDDLILLCETLFKYDPSDLDMYEPDCLARVLKPDLNHDDYTPRFACIEGPAWDFVEPYIPSLFDTYRQKLEEFTVDVNLSGIFQGALDAHTTIMDANIWFNLSKFGCHGSQFLLPETLSRINRGKSIMASDYIRAIELIGSIEVALKQLLNHYDALITVSATGEAPIGLNYTGDSALQKI